MSSALEAHALDKGRPTIICSACDDNGSEILYFCDPRVGRNGFKVHVELEHFLKIKVLSITT